MKSQIETAFELYRKLIFEVPYSSISQLYIYFSEEEIPLSFGLPCALQLKVLTDWFTIAGIDFIGHVDNRHAVIIVSFEGEKYLFDPYLLHRGLINISQIEKGNFVDFDAYPIRSNGDQKMPSLFKVNYMPENNRIATAYSQYIVETGMMKTIRRFRFHLDKTIVTLPPKEKLLPMFFHPEQTTLAIRVLFEFDESMVHVIYPICWYFRKGNHSKDNLLLKTNDGIILSKSSSEFSYYVSKVADYLKCSEADIFDHIIKAVDIYEQNAPQTVPFHDYSPVLS